MGFLKAGGPRSRSQNVGKFDRRPPRRFGVRHRLEREEPHARGHREEARGVRRVHSV